MRLTATPNDKNRQWWRCPYCSWLYVTDIKMKASAVNRINEHIKVKHHVRPQLNSD